MNISSWISMVQGPMTGDGGRFSMGRTRGAVLLLLVIFSFSTLAEAQVKKIDLFGPGTRWITDVTTGALKPISETGNAIIDIIIIGEGYTCANPSNPADCEQDEFDLHAQDWYDRIFGTGGGDGIRPYNEYRRLFRVHSVFHASNDHASVDRTSYYKVKVSCGEEPCSIDKGGWQADGSNPDNVDFRNRLFAAVDEVGAVAPLNESVYPDELTVPKMSGVHRNLVVAILVRGYRDAAKTDPGQLSGFSDNVLEIPDPPGTPARNVRVAFGQGWEHEFSHAFAYLKDEYINERGTTASGTNPAPAERSVFNLSNISYSNQRCELMWPHLAPGGRYNPSPHSLIGNLFKGGFEEEGAWHSEYICLMNGGHANFFCNDDESGIPVDAYIRDHGHFCFWCEEIVALRILEKARELVRAGDPADFNDKGRAWFQLWDGSLRHDYYTHFDIPQEIARKDACYNYLTGTPCPAHLPQCEQACEDVFLDKNRAPYRPGCIRECNIRDIGNAVFVNSDAGMIGFGTSKFPYRDLATAVSQSQALCTDTGDPHVIAIQSGNYPDPMTLSDPATLTAAGCGSILLGQ